MLCHDRNDSSERISLAMNKECFVSHYWLINHGFTFQNSVCNSCHDLTMLYLDISDVATITVNYHCFIYGISNSGAICLLENSVLDDRGHV